MKKNRRGFSFGTIFILALTIVIVIAIGRIFPKLSGNTNLNLNPQKIVATVLSAVDLPQLSLSEIPIQNHQSLGGEKPAECENNKQEKRVK